MMTQRLNKFTNNLPLPVIAATFAVGLCGGIAAKFLSLPLPMLLGSLLTVGSCSALGVKFFGHNPAVPEKWRMVFMPIIGTAIGGSVPADFFAQLALWWPTVLAIFVFVPLAHMLGHLLYTRFGKLDAVTSYFASMPGGFIEAMEMGQERGADMPMLSILQFLRLILCIVLVPVLYTVISGQMVGSASGVEIPGARIPLQAIDILVLLLCGVVGALGGRKAGLPAAILVGPMALSGIAHATGLTHAVPPSWMIDLTQWVVGTTLGMRFAGFALPKLWQATKLAFVYIMMTLSLALGIALLLASPAGQPVSAVVLAFAAGGVTEMALVAISLNLSAVYVTLHHVVRIIFTVSIARYGYRFVDPTRR